jgi:hypothetical protein
MILEQAAVAGGRSTGITLKDAFSPSFSSTGGITWLNNRVQVLNYSNCSVKFTFLELLKYYL